MTTLKESFEWMAPEFKIVDSGKNTIRIKGVAMKSNVVSRNKRKYVDEELKKAARTWIGKPVTINHDMSRKVGDVKWMEYEGGALEYLADIKKEPYVSMLRDKSTNIKGVSIEANYLHNRCPQCGQKFYSEEEFHSHMHEAHFVKTDPQKEVHGMFGTALSLVLSPEEPGYVGTTIDLMEMYEKPVLRLLETVIIREKEKIDYMKHLEGKAVTRPESRQTFDKQLREKKAKEQEETPSPPCPEGWHEAEGKCVKDITEQEEGQLEPAHPTEEGGKECPEGSHWDETSGTCVPDEVPESHTAEPAPPAEKTTTETECPAGFHEQEGICVADEIPAVTPPTEAPKVSEPSIPVDLVEHPVAAEQDDNIQPVPHPTEKGGHECLEGSHWDEVAGTCIPDEIPESSTTTPPEVPTKVIEVKLPPKLKLAEPCSPELKRCVDKLIADGKPEDSAWAICRSQVGETAPPNNLYEAHSTLKTRLENIAETGFARDSKIAEDTNLLIDAVAHLAVKGEGFGRSLNLLTEHTRQAIIKEATLRHAYDRGTAKKIFLELGKLDTSLKQTREYLDKKLSQLATANMQTNKALETKVKAVNEIVASIHTATAANAESITKAKEDFDKTLSIADTNVKEIRKQYEELQEKMKEQEEPEKHECPEGEHWDGEKCVPDAPPQQSQEVKEMLTRLENLEDKLKPQFKASTPIKLQESKNKGEYYDDPLKQPKKKGR